MKDPARSYSSIVNRLMFDYESIDNSDLLIELSSLPRKLLRWLATHHPDNRCRKLFLRNSNVNIGHKTVINSGFIVSDDYEPLLTIGERVAISPNVVVICASAPNNSEIVKIPRFKETLIKSLPVTIEDDVWLGSGVIILPGVRIGQGSVIGAGAVVNRDIPRETIFAGSPARKIGMIYREN